METRQMRIQLVIFCIVRPVSSFFLFVMEVFLFFVKSQSRLDCIRPLVTDVPKKCAPPRQVIEYFHFLK